MERVTIVERRGTSLENVHREAAVVVEVTEPVLIVEKKDIFQENVPLAEVDVVVVEEGAEAEEVGEDNPTRQVSISYHRTVVWMLITSCLYLSLDK